MIAGTVYAARLRDLGPKRMCDGYPAFLTLARGTGRILYHARPGRHYRTKQTLVKAVDIFRGVGACEENHALTIMYFPLGESIYGE
jgi:hypothetical protein